MFFQNKQKTYVSDLFVVLVRSEKITMFYWFVIAYVTTLKEKQSCLKTLSNISVPCETTIFALVFGPNTNSLIQLFQIDIDGICNIEIYHVNNHHPHQNMYKRYDTVFNKIIHQFKLQKIKIDGVLYYGHSSGIILGLWQGQKIFTTVTRFVKNILIPLQPTILMFDSCYMGTLSALFELSVVKSLRYVIASSYYHPGFSILQTKAFSKIKNTNDIHQLHRITSEFQQRRGPRYSCLLLFEIQKIPALVAKIKVAVENHELIFDQDSVVNKMEDLYDLYTSAHEESLKKQIQEISKQSCSVNKCYKIRGVTIDIALPDRHIQVYKKMKWYCEMKSVMYID
jgi:hypothetical protein